ncbi:hypothetical protein Ocin01_14401 [Orchesella cincta]|uniref:Uncharacterized protein n=1 Tax=Orchesella cincta TaxID=48709 RepID=A0A1D2MHH7_ORCCI|nr:hypothetical protein Ocin01_14401 [Orchesella cincta]
MASRVDLISVALVALVHLAVVSEGFPYRRWYDYDNFPSASEIHETGAGHVEELHVNPLRPYEPWTPDCILLSRDKVEEGKRHPRCQTVDETNEKEYAKYLFYVEQWEGAYPDRAAKWNLRFPDGKAQERMKYDKLKALADMHNLKRTEASANYCPDCNSEPESPPAADDDEVVEEASNRRTSKLRYSRS